MVELHPIDWDNVRAVFDLQVAPHQRRHVAPNPWSLAQALAVGEQAWPRAIVVDGEVVGFLMLGIDPDDEHPFELWRLMVGVGYQRKGYGRLALALAIEEARRRGATRLWTSWVPGDGGPEGFYRRLGFEPTGEMRGGEAVGVLAI
jgi:diamine N-acetyltransferase